MADWYSSRIKNLLSTWILPQVKKQTVVDRWQWPLPFPPLPAPSLWNCCSFKIFLKEFYEVNDEWKFFMTHWHDKSWMVRPKKGLDSCKPVLFSFGVGWTFMTLLSSYMYGAPLLMLRSLHNLCIPWVRALNNNCFTIQKFGRFGGKKSIKNGFVPGDVLAYKGELMRESL